MKHKRASESRSEQERMLDEALAETFPASDPISMQQIVIVGEVERPLRSGGSGAKPEHRHDLPKSPANR
jgi:hypothetical protein